MRVRIIGVGNDYRGDDGAGLAVVRAPFSLMFPPYVEVKEESGEATALLDAFQGIDAVILVDAVLSGTPPGTIHRFDVCEQSPRSVLFASSTHAFGVSQAIELARTLDLLPPRLLVYGIEGFDFTLGAPITPDVVTSLSRVAQLIAKEADILSIG